MAFLSAMSDNGVGSGDREQGYEEGRQAILKGVSASGGRQWRGEDDRAVSSPDARVGN